MLSLRLAVPALVAVLFQTPTALAQPEFEAVDLQPMLSGFAGTTYAFSVNDQGQVVGRYSGDNAFFYDGAVMHDLVPHPNTVFVMADNLNNHGQWTGVSRATEGSRTYWYDGDQYVDLGLQDTFGSIYGMNDHGLMVGSVFDGSDSRTFLYEEQAKTWLTDLPLNTRPMDINNMGWIVGSGPGIGAFVYDGTNLINIPVPVSSASGISDTGFVSVFGGSFQNRAYRYDINTGELIDITPDVPNLISAQARAVNDDGWVVGDVDYDGVVSSFLFDGEQTYLLPDLVPEIGFFGTPRDISNAGHIVGDHHMLTLVPEPSSILLVGAGAILLLRRRRTPKDIATSLQAED